MSDAPAPPNAAAHGTLPVCLLCTGTLERVRRAGFLQERILPLFTRYPWRCVLCHDVTFRTARHRGELRMQYGVPK